MSDLRDVVLEKIDRRLGLCDQAPPGPWEKRPWPLVYGSDHPDVRHLAGPVHAVGRAMEDGTWQWVTTAAERSAAFIASARSGYPAAMRILRREIERHEVTYRTRSTGRPSYFESENRAGRGETYRSEECKACGRGWPCPTLVEADKELGP